MNDLIDYTNLNIIDDIYKQHRLIKITEFVDNYNDHHDDKIIITNIEEMIIELWMNKQDIPEVLTFGYPYDESFKKCIIEIDLIFLFQNADCLSDFLFLTLKLPTIKYSYNDNIDQFNILLNKSQHKSIKYYEDFRRILIDKKLTKLDLIYLACGCQQYKLYNSYYNITDFKTFVKYSNFKLTESILDSKAIRKVASQYIDDDSNYSTEELILYMWLQGQKLNDLCFGKPYDKVFKSDLFNRINKHNLGYNELNLYFKHRNILLKFFLLAYKLPQVIDYESETNMTSFYDGMAKIPKFIDNPIKCYEDILIKIDNNNFTMIDLIYTMYLSTAYIFDYINYIETFKQYIQYKN